MSCARPLRAVAIAALGWTAACGYDAPLDPDAPPLGNIISGEVIIDKLAASGPAFVILSAEDNPTPPLGRGSPITFTSVPAGNFEIGLDGLRGASYALTGLADGGYYLSALLDQDRNFHPSASTLAGASCGDAVGRYISDLEQAAATPVRVADSQWRRSVPVLVTSTLQTSRPAFTIGADVTAGFGGAVVLSSVAMTATFGSDLRVGIPGPFTPANGDTCESAFWFRRIDADGDGNADRDPDNPLAEARWPQIILQWLGDPIDTDSDGLIDIFDRSALPDAQQAATWATAATPVPMVGGLDVPDDQLPPPGVVAPFIEMRARIAPLGRRVDASTGPAGEIVDASAMPRGAYSVTVIGETGQTWAIPNELDTALALSRALPPPGVTSPRNETQGRYVMIE